MNLSKNDRDELRDEQMYSALSFSIMLILIGVPLWWKTTEVYRVSLPYSEINQLDRLNTKIQINIHVVTIDEVKGTTLINDLKNIFKISKIYNINFKQHATDKALLGSSKTLEDIEKSIKHPNFEGSLQVFEVPGLTRFTPKNIIPGRNRTVYFSSDTDAIKLYDFLTKKILYENSLQDAILQITLPAQNNVRQKSKHQVPLSSEIDILFTILNPDPESFDVELNIHEAIEEYFNPFIQKLNGIFKFFIKSQWLYFVSLEVQPKFINQTDKGPHFALASELLPHVITPLEKKLASHVSKYSCLNFVLYVTPCNFVPLHIYSKKSFQVEEANAFVSPKWGGIQIYNPSRQSCVHGKKGRVVVNKHQSMTIFLEQFKFLLGIKEINDDNILNYESDLRLWEKDLLLKMKTIRQLTAAKLTLKSLSKLLGKINNIVINDQVGDSINSALKNIYLATSALENGSLFQSHSASEKAFLDSEKAFTDPSLLALLYFPDDQKYAVYIPLFLPVMIPVFISFKHIVNWASFKLKVNSKPKVE